jgi:cytochrome c553
LSKTEFRNACFEPLLEQAQLESAKIRRRKKMKKLVVAMLVMSPILSALCFADDLVDDPNFKAKCVMCHGAAAEGREKMKTPPMKEKAGKSVAELTKAIEEGNDKTTPKMPPFKDKLTPEQIKALVDEIKALK